MRSTQQCPKCQGRKLYVIDPVRQADPENRNMVMVQPVTYAYTGIRLEAGSIEAWVCAGCGFMESYAKNAVDTLWQMAQRSKTTGVRYIDGAPDANTPYR